VWKIVEAKVRKVRIAKTEGGREKWRRG